MSKVPVFALHEIEYLDGKGKKYAAPGSVFEIEDTLAKKLAERANPAVRAPTDAEMALYEKQNKPARKAASKANDGDGGNGGDGENGGDGGKGKGGRGKGKREEAPV